LKASFQAVDPAVESKLQTIRDSIRKDSNYSVYRQTLNSIYFSGECCIPYLGMFLTDLTFIDEGNKNSTFIAKSELVYDILNMIMSFQHNTGERTPRKVCDKFISTTQLDSNLLVFIESFQGSYITEDELFKQSKMREAPSGDSPRSSVSSVN
jgi:hypothetical protein